MDVSTKKVLLAPLRGRLQRRIDTPPAPSTARTKLGAERSQPRRRPQRFARCGMSVARSMSRPAPLLMNVSGEGGPWPHWRRPHLPFAVMTPAPSSPMLGTLVTSEIKRVQFARSTKWHSVGKSPTRCSSPPPPVTGETLKHAHPEKEGRQHQGQKGGTPTPRASASVTHASAERRRASLHPPEGECLGHPTSAFSGAAAASPKALCAAAAPPAQSSCTASRPLPLVGAASAGGED